jgi:putative hydrolase of the HAD superfamily
MTPKTLFFDADDTLWDEQRMLQGFEKAVEIALDDVLGIPSNFAKRFIALEEENIPHIGYGFPSYMFSVGEAITANPDWYPHKKLLLSRVREIIRQFAEDGPTLIADVPETLKALKDKGYNLNVLTRGVEFEQKFKLEKSGIKSFFTHIVIVQTKDENTYRNTAEKFGYNPNDLCMIGNSVRADVNPALAAGWHAVHIPAPTSWSHDEAAALDHPRGGQVARFSGLLDIF